MEELEIDACPHLLEASLIVPSICKLKMVDFGKLILDYDLAMETLQTSEIEILKVSQWNQLPVTLHQKLSIRECNYVESLLEEEQLLQTNIYDLKIQDCSFSRSL